MLSTKISFFNSGPIVIAALFLAGCSSISVNQDYDPAYDFAKLKTYGFIPITEEAGIDQLNATRLGDAIKANLTAKGYTLAENADFGIAFSTDYQDKHSIHRRIWLWLWLWLQRLWWNGRQYVRYSIR